MLLMSYISSRSRRLWFIRSLTRFIRRGADSTPVEPPGTPAAKTARAHNILKSIDDRAHSRDTIPSSGPPSCNDPDAVYNLAALRSGLLSPREIPGLAEHVSQCETCQIVLAMIVKEMPHVESTANHAAVPAPVTGPEVSTGTRPKSRAPTDKALS